MMAQSFRRFLLSLFLLINPVLLIGQGRLRVSEEKTRMVPGETGGVLKLVIESDVARDLPVRVDLQMLDAADTVLELQSYRLLLPRGSKQVDIPIKETRQAVSIWERIKYQVEAAEPGVNVIGARGVVAISEISPQPFVLRLALPSGAAAGERLRVHVFTQHPSSGCPIANVAITGTIRVSDDEGEHTLNAVARSNSSGYATVAFDLPPQMEDASAIVEIDGRSGRFTQRVEEDIRFIDRSKVVVTTDKPIYQPGQHLRVRAVLFDNAQRPKGQTQLQVSVRSFEGLSMYQTELTTSPFGEADTDWVIPDNARVGDYQVQVRSEDTGRSVVHPVKISRYDLPAFTVLSVPDRAYYLPGQNARVEVKAEYLFGQPVKQGHVRIVRQVKHLWNSREQKWETTEEAPVEGDLAPNGAFAATIDLRQEHDDLGDREYQLFADLNYAAYLTDATTNRTEERKFDIRISKEPIHIYVSQGRQPEGLPLEFYVSAFYADGTPSRSRISVYEAERGAPVFTASTNKYGVAKIAGLRSKAESFIFKADDGKGRHGRHEQSIRREESGLRIHTNKTLYRHGEPLSVEIRSTRAVGPAVLELSKAGTVIHSQVFQLRNGSAWVVIPYDEKFEDDITVGARYIGNPGEDDNGFGAHTVAYPRDRDLKIDARLNKQSYAPGDEASLVMRVRTPDGLIQPAVAGVVVLDKAVEERARTDNEFGYEHWFCDLCGAWQGVNQTLGGLSRRDLDHLDLSEPVPADLELAAELLLNTGGNNWPREQLTEDQDSDPGRAFKALIQRTLSPLKSALDAQFAKDASHPVDAATLNELLSIAGLDPDMFRDPWGTPYRYSFSIEYGLDVMRIDSAGPDKRFGSSDDIHALSLTWPYFNPRGKVIDDVVHAYYRRTGRFIRDLSALKSELLPAGEHIESWTDRWGQPYRFLFGANRNLLTITVRSSGPNRVFEPDGKFPSDDFIVWTSSINWTEQAQNALLQLTSDYFQSTNTFPEDATAFNSALNQDGAVKALLLDPWMHPCYPTFKTDYSFTDRIAVMTYADYLRNRLQETSVTPVTARIKFLVLRSAGPDGIEGTADDFDVAVVSRVLAEQSASDASARSTIEAPLLSGAGGGVQGVTTDETLAVIPGVTVIAKSLSQGDFRTTSDMEGRFLMRNLPPGSYDVSFEIPGFNRRVIQQVPVAAGAATALNMTLYVASAAAQMVSVDVAADTLAFRTTSASVSSIVEAGGTKMLSVMATPKLRDYFPETLVWQPALETDRGGRLRWKFKIADNITTWKLAAVVSTMDGQLGFVEKEFVSTQPFFVEHDPPRILTQGDQVELLVVLRSYLDKEQSVDLSVHPAEWFELSGSATKTALIRPGEAVRQTFSLKAVKPTADGAQRITARGSLASDSIQKPVTVIPDGKEVVGVSSDIFREPLSRLFVLPSGAIPNTAHAEVRIYPDLMAHIVDGIEGILQRPYGCAEQTISSAYPSLILLKHLNRQGNGSPALKAKAQRYFRMGLDRLWAYQNSDGSFTYWGAGAGDIAVTAFAMQFLDDASELAPVDMAALGRAAAWIERQQREDGSWGDPDITALVARVLSLPNLRSKIGRRNTMAAAIDYLRGQANSLAEPYALASLAIAASNLGDTDVMTEALEGLQQNVHRERSGAYWDLQTNTPFYGWGTAGRLETTALVVRAFETAQMDSALVDQGLLFLLRNQDRFGVWYSSQATVDVLEALMTISGRTQQNIGASATDIIVNGHRVTSVTIPGGSQSMNPITVDVSQFLTEGQNRIEINGRPGGTASVEFVEKYYMPWSGVNTAGSSPEAGSLRLSVHFDKTEAKVGDDIHCHVDAERVGFRGYGMMLAEIGLPPGADVDRGSLEAAIQTGNWDLYRYDVLPDRLIVYLWPRAGGSPFDFKFRVRYGINAQSAASTIYDYYNPDAQVTVQPVRFLIGEN